jgi:hypothetical protein
VANIINKQNTTIAQQTTHIQKLDKSLSDLRAKHKALIEDSVAVEIQLGESDEAISKMCKGCVMQSTTECITCPLYPVAIQHELW